MLTPIKFEKGATKYLADTLEVRNPKQKESKLIEVRIVMHYLSLHKNFQLVL